MNWKQVVGALIGGGLVYVVLAVRAIPTTGVSSLNETLRNPVPPARADISGTRLKTKYIAGADGLRFADADVMWDSNLETDCNFRTAADGTTRCLPLGPDPSWGAFGWGYLVFTDDACTDALMWVPPTSPGCPAVVPSYVINYTDPPYCSGEPVREHIYPVGAVIPPPGAAGYRLDESGACVSGAAMPSPGTAPPGAYAVGAEIPASSFAAGTAGIDP